MRSLFKISLLFSIPILIFISSANVISKEAESCSDFEFIFARGSGQNLNDTDFKAFKSAISTKLSGYSFNIYELGQNGTSESYPAISVSNFKAISVFLSAGKSYEFSESVEKGVKELKSRIVSELKRCKNKKFILAGYSQGALVINYTLPDIDANKIVYAATFGDPKLYLPEGEGFEGEGFDDEEEEEEEEPEEEFPDEDAIFGFDNNVDEDDYEDDDEEDDV